MQVTAARRAVLLCSLAATIFSGCAPQQAFTPRLTSDLVATPTPGAQAEAGGSRGGSAMSAEQSVSVVSQAYALLLQTYVEPADPVALLHAAWDGFAAALPADQPRPERPQLGGVDVREDLNRFRTAYLAAAAPAGGATRGRPAWPTPPCGAWPPA